MMFNSNFSRIIVLVLLLFAESVLAADARSLYVVECDNVDCGCPSAILKTDEGEFMFGRSNGTLDSFVPYEPAYSLQHINHDYYSIDRKGFFNPLDISYDRDSTNISGNLVLEISIPGFSDDLQQALTLVITSRMNDLWRAVEIVTADSLIRLPYDFRYMEMWILYHPSTVNQYKSCLQSVATQFSAMLNYTGLYYMSDMEKCVSKYNKAKVVIPSFELLKEHPCVDCDFVEVTDDYCKWRDIKYIRSRK